MTFYKNSKGMKLKVYNKFLEANLGWRDTKKRDPEVGTYIMFLKKFARPNKKISRMNASVGRFQCVHANGFIVVFGWDTDGPSPFVIA